MTTPWQPGQRAIIDRRAVVTIDRVTPSGRAVVGERTFDPNGNERGRSGSWRCAKLELITPEIEAELTFAEWAREAYSAVVKEMDAAETWLRRNFGVWSRTLTAAAADVDRAERLAAAIRQVMEGVA